MSKLFLGLLRERCRRYKRFVINKPIATIGLLISLFSLIYMLVDEGVTSFCVSEYLNYPIIVFAVMVYLIAKIINPTQETMIDYQLLELKLLSFGQFKVLMATKMLIGSIVFSMVCMNSYTKIVAVISIMNAMVNFWVFLRNRWNNRVYDLIVVCALIICIKYQFLYLSLLCGSIMFLIYVLITRVNYDSLLPLYKLVYRISQQRYMGEVYSEKETRDIETSAETLLGKPKEKNSDWCSKLYEKRNIFEMNKEMARIYANRNKLIGHLIINLMLGISIFYVPEGYDYIVFAIIAFSAVSFSIMMNQKEANLLMRGFIEKYSLWNIMKRKILVYSVCNFILMLPSVMLGWIWLSFAAITSILISFFVIGKYFR